MSEDKEVTVEVTPEDMEFRARAKAAGLPDVLISVYGTALRRLVADEREACAAFLDRGVDLSDLAEHPAWQRYSADLLTACAAAIRARKP